MRRRAALLATAITCAACIAGGASVGAAPAAEFAPAEILVGYRTAPSDASEAAVNAGAPVRRRVLRLAAGVSVAAELTRLRSEPRVLWAVPDYIAHSTGKFVPDDPGEGTLPGEWEKLQWNLVGQFGVNAEEAWANVAADGAPGGQGVVVAVLDTGVAYANRGPFRLSPDFDRYQFVQGYDFVAHDPWPNDRNGHGTFVASEIAEATNNGKGLTGLAYGTRIMPVRVLDSAGEGEASTIAEGLVYAVKHGARIVNMSLEFSPGVTEGDIPELIEAIRYAHRRGVLVVAAAGNEGTGSLDFPARAPDVLAVGATTEHGCLASYSNFGAGLALVAPGGGPDDALAGDPNCRPEGPSGRDIFQVTFTGSSPRIFGIPGGYEGTSMATPEVAATAALVIASGVLGPHPTPAQITSRLRATATKLGGGGDEAMYGAGLLDAAAATAPGGPGAAAG